MLEDDPIESRRDKNAVNFASKVLKHPEHRNMFNIVDSNAVDLDC